MADLYLTPAEKYTAALGGFYYGDLPEPGTVYTQLIKDILDGSTPDKVPKNILARFIYSLYISDLGDPYPRYELAKLLYWKLHDITPTKSGSILTVTIDGEEDYMTINTDLSRLWYKVLFGSKTDVITEFPYIFNTMQNKLSDWELFGNVEVFGTPTPDSPIMPEGTGERTGNLLNLSYQNFTIKNIEVTAQGSIINFNGTSSGEISSGSVAWKVLTFTLPAGEYRINITRGFSRYVKSVDGTTLLDDWQTNLTLSEETQCYLAFYFISGKTIDSDIEFMLNLGSTALPYEPYGYKIPISSASTTTPVYLGEVQTTRLVKKLVFDGTENVSYNARNDILKRWVVTIPIDNGTTTPENVISTHFKTVNNTQKPLTEGGICMRSTGSSVVVGGLYTDIGITSPSDSTTIVNAVKSYLAQQYANGTPVCVWYVLATEETAVVNEPLMKIGGYADSMSRTQTGIDIPTVVGQNTLDVLTTVKPSSMRIEYTSADETRSRSKRISLLKSPLKKGLIK